MATAKKLPSGSWRCQVFSHYEPVFDEQGRVVIDPKTKRSKKKRIYESFTRNDPTCRGKIEAEILANEFYLNRKRKSRHTDRLTLFEAIEKYITASNVSLSPKTIEEYWKIRKNCFQSIMDIELRNLTDDILQDAITEESQRPNRRCTKIRGQYLPKPFAMAWYLPLSISISTDIHRMSSYRKFRRKLLISLHRKSYSTLSKGQIRASHS